jgi:hypothetical protein
MRHGEGKWKQPYEKEQENVAILAPRFQRMLSLAADVKAVCPEQQFADDIEVDKLVRTVFRKLIFKEI